jgi:hypothetical protein
MRRIAEGTLIVPGSGSPVRRCTEDRISLYPKYRDDNSLQISRNRLKNAYYLRHTENSIRRYTAHDEEDHGERNGWAAGMRVIRSTIKETGGVTHIGLWFKALDQLIDPDDPGVLSEKELTEEAEDRLYSLVNEIKVASPVQLVIHLPKVDESPGKMIDLPRAIRSHFAFRLTELEGEKKASWHEGQVSFFIAILNACLIITIGWLYADYSTSYPFLLLTGLVIILNWVTVWDTYEYFVYDWRHLWRKRRIYKKISRMDIQVHHAG